MKTFYLIALSLVGHLLHSQVLVNADFEDETRWSLYTDGQEIDGLKMLDSNVLGKGSIIVAGDPPPNSRYYTALFKDHLDVSMFQGTSGFVLALFGASGPTRFSSDLYNSELVIDKIYVRKDKKDGYNYIDAWGHINGVSGWQGYFTCVNMLTALSSEEIRYEHYITRNEAIRRLKEAKELYELELYSKDTYDSLKLLLTPLIIDKD